MRHRLYHYMLLMRLHKPTGILLLLWPGLWSMSLSQPPVETWIVLSILFVIGAVVMRSAGCVINDLWDYRIDRQVERTRDRPLASRQVNIAEAVCLCCLLLIIGASILWRLTPLVIILGVVFVLMVGIYPATKRWMAMPQLFLGLTINAGALMGWAAVHNSLSWAAWCLYIACFFWTLAYDTIYAHQDRADDVKIGIGSAAIVLSEHTKAYLFVFYGVAVAFFVIAGILAAQGWVYSISVVSMFLILGYRLHRVDLGNRRACWTLFASHGILGGLPWGALIVERMVGSLI